jgi:hypothetical protein
MLRPFAAKCLVMLLDFVVKQYKAPFGAVDLETSQTEKTTK